MPQIDTYDQLTEGKLEPKTIKGMKLMLLAAKEIADNEEWQEIVNKLVEQYDNLLYNAKQLNKLAQELAKEVNG